MKENTMYQRPKILIVDDEPRMCESLRLLLGNQGYEIHTANSGQEARDALTTLRFDLALLDIVMPDMDGHQLMDHISLRNPDTMIIAITGHASLESAVAALRRGAYDYLRKPFEYEELLKTVQNALNQKQLKSEKRIADGKLELSEERYRYLVENSPDIIYTLDDEGNFTFTSNAVERVLGYSSKSLIGQHYTTIIFNDDMEKAKLFFNERRTGDRATNGIELQLKCHVKSQLTAGSPEAKTIPVELKATGMYDKPPGKEDRKFLGTHGVVRDISSRKRLEAQLQHAQKMEAVGTLAGGIAHDFNNLLMAIQGYTSLMLLEIGSSHPYYDKLKSIEEYIQSGAELTKQLLGFARGGKYDVQPLDLNELLRKTSRMFGRS
jgi:PAS domain S-box-containing protein